MRSVFLPGSPYARKPREPPTITPIRYTILHGLRGPPDTQEELTFIDLATRKQTKYSEFKTKIANICLLFIDDSEHCQKQRPAINEFLGKITSEEMPCRVIIVPIPDYKTKPASMGLDREEYQRLLEGISGGGLVIPSHSDPRLHILKSWREDYLSPTPLLAMLDSAGNRINKNAWQDMLVDIKVTEETGPRIFREFPYRNLRAQAIRSFKSDWVDPALIDCPCILLVRLYSTNEQSEAVSQLYEKAAATYKEARGEVSTLKFFETRTKEQVESVREKDKCRNGHPLVKRGAFDQSRCNGCVELGAEYLSCIRDDFNLCQKCYDKEIQIDHPDVLLLTLLCNEFGRDPPVGKVCLLGWSYATGLFVALGQNGIENDEEMYSFFQRVDKC